MRYLPPPTWPPPDDWPLPGDDWRPAPGWRPRPGVPLSADGEFYLVHLPSKTTETETPPGEEEQFRRAVATRMVAVWARPVMISAHQYHLSAMKAAWTDRALEWNEEWSPTLRDLRQALDELWVRGYQFVTAAYQMERWRLAYEGVGPDQEEPPNLRALRNSLEHLDGARFSQFAAHKGVGKDDARSIDYLPGKELFLGFNSSYVTTAFGVLDLAVTTERARPYLYVDEYDPDEYSESG